MSYIFFDIHDILTEADAVEIAHAWKREVIEVSESVRGKRGKIRSTESKVKQLVKLCYAEQWKEPKKVLDRAVKQLEQCKAEDDFSLWRV